jgi:Carboxypeptidase regulatory-like domain
MFKQIFNSAVSLAVLAALLPAQSYYGGLRGTILDQNGGVIAGAKVALINEGTSEPRSVVSTQAGEFVFSELVPATYAVSVESPGFKKFGPISRMFCPWRTTTELRRRRAYSGLRERGRVTASPDGLARQAPVHGRVSRQE